ncbi:MAG: hypothetical protein PHR35_00160 [Kiritimatiellae bacterium]|nr:hypothetical protein [Kiritimatiellia bacterium]
MLLSSRVWQRSLVRAGLFRVITARQDIERYQTRVFNAVWQDACADVPFYEAWRERNRLPTRVETVADLETWPVIAKRELQEAGRTLNRKSGPPTGHMMTGGSTGEPLRFGTWPDDGTMSSSQWIGRSGYGYEPGMRQFLLWGHRHLYGKGVRRTVKTMMRAIKDELSSMKRVSAYDLSAPAMRQACDRLIRFRPEVIIGFSAAVVACCRANRDRRGTSRTLGVKFVLCTAGPLSRDETAMIEDFFAAPVCMEYGSVECGPMAYTEPDSGAYKVFWDTHLLQTIPDEDDRHRNIVTRLTRCYVPLIRYDVGDQIELFPDERIRPHRFARVIGRPSDIVRLADGSSFFGAVIGDCVKQVPRILASQTIVRGNEIEIDVLADGDLTEAERDLICGRCRLAVPALQAHVIVVRQQQALRTTRGGKVPLVIRE